MHILSIQAEFVKISEQCAERCPAGSRTYIVDGILYYITEPANLSTTTASLPTTWGPTAGSPARHKRR